MNKFYVKENNKFNAILSQSIYNSPEIYKLIKVIKNDINDKINIIKN